MTNLDLQTLVIAHGWILTALLILVAALTQMMRQPPPFYWLYSDVAGLFALLGIYLMITWGGNGSLIIFAFFLYFKFYFRIVALSPPTFQKNFKRIALTSLIPLLLFNLFAEHASLTFKLSINFCAFFILSACLIYVGAWINRNDNKIGRVLIGLAGVAYIVIAIIRADTLLDPTSLAGADGAAFSTLTLTMMMISGISVHIGFIIFVLDRMNRAEWISEQALLRETERRAYAEAREKEILAQADEQSRLIDVLTHEVRQPLNNASAALQSITDELNVDRTMRESHGIARAQAVIDKVGMALSNALVAATILERKQKFNPVRYDPMLLIDMVIMDFNDADRMRIKLNVDHAPLYITADPILLRIALRNLINNALRYSPKNTHVSLKLVENEEDIGAEFQVTNEEPQEIDFNKTDIFERRVRARSDGPEGSGLGLYITQEIAKIHRGWVKTSYKAGKRIFKFFIQD